MGCYVMVVKSIYDMRTEVIPPSHRENLVCSKCGKNIPIKYRLINPYTKESREFCNMCYFKVMMNLKVVEEITHDDFFNIPKSNE